MRMASLDRAFQVERALLLLVLVRCCTVFLHHSDCLVVSLVCPCRRETASFLAKNHGLLLGQDRQQNRGIKTTCSIDLSVYRNTVRVAFCLLSPHARAVTDAQNHICQQSASAAASVDVEPLSLSLRAFDWQLKVEEFLRAHTLTVMQAGAF